MLSSRSSEKSSVKSTARVAGWLYLAIIVSSLISVFFGPFMKVGDPVETLLTLRTRAWLYRADSIYNIAMFSAVIALAACLHSIVKSVNPTLALLALLWRVGEALAGAGFTILVEFAPFALLKDEMMSKAFSEDQMLAILSLLGSGAEGCMHFLTVFLGLGTFTFFLLFYKSKLLPKWLSLFGMVSMCLMIVGEIGGIVWPAEVWDVLPLPVMIFEIVVGVWMIVYGVLEEEGVTSGETILSRDDGNDQSKKTT